MSTGGFNYVLRYRENKKKNDLEHHGILGMRWGRKNGPPYPLDGSDHSASEKKAGWKKSLGGGRNESEYGRNEKKTKDNKINKKRAKSLEKDVQKEYKKAETEEYIKSGSKLDKLTGDDYFNEIDRIQADAFKKTFDNLVKKYGDLSTSDMDFLSKSKKGKQFMRSKRIYDEDNKRKSGSGKINNDELDRLISERKKATNMEQFSKIDEKTYKYLTDNMTGKQKEKLKSAINEYKRTSDAVDKANDDNYKSAYSEYEKADSALREVSKSIINEMTDGKTYKDIEWLMEWRTRN